MEHMKSQWNCIIFVIVSFLSPVPYVKRFLLLYMLHCIVYFVIKSSSLDK